MRLRAAFLVLGACLVLLAGFGARQAQAQALCGQGFGTTGLELCVTVESGPGTLAMFD